MRRASVADRLNRLAGLRPTGDVERTVRELAAEYGLHPAEVRAELADVAGRVQRFGPWTPARAIERCAEELGLPEAEIRDEYALITGAAGGLL